MRPPKSNVFSSEIVSQKLGKSDCVLSTNRSPVSPFYASADIGPGLSRHMVSMDAPSHQLKVIDQSVYCEATTQTTDTTEDLYGRLNLMPKKTTMGQRENAPMTSHPNDTSSSSTNEETSIVDNHIYY